MQDMVVLYDYRIEYMTIQFTLYIKKVKQNKLIHSLFIIL